MSTSTVSPQFCPKWKTCSASVCPLDPNHSRHNTLRGEAVCPWLREAMRPDGAARIPAAIAPAILHALPALLADGGAVLRDKLKRAGDSTPRMPLRAPKGHPVPGALASCHTYPAAPLQMPSGGEAMEAAP